MLIDLARRPTEALHPAGTVIVGAGPVGLCLAVDLARRGQEVLVLEAGGERVESRSQAIFEAAVWGGRKLEGLHLGRFRALGGGSNFWGGQLVGFDPIVAERREWVSDLGWPFPIADLHPYYARAYAMLGVDARPDAAVWARLGVALPEFGPDLQLFLTRWASEPNLAHWFRSDIHNLKNLRIAVNAPVCGFMREGGAITGLIVRSPSGDLRVPAARVVLANGTIEIARLLMASAADDAGAPWAANPWLGRGFADHVDVSVARVDVLDRKRFHDLFDNVFVEGAKYQPKLKLASRAQIENRLYGACAQFNFLSRHSAKLNDAKLFFRGLLRGRFDGALAELPGRIASALQVGLPMLVRYIRYNRMYNPTDAGVQLRVSCEHAPDAGRSLSFTGGNDALGMPIVQVNWTVPDDILKTLQYFTRAIAAEFEKSGMARLRIDEALERGDPAFLDHVDDTNHQMGMARMAASAADGVVDPDLKVHGTDNLYVAGAAVYPATGFENPTFSAIALALRLADHLTVRAR